MILHAAVVEGGRLCEFVNAATSKTMPSRRGTRKACAKRAALALLGGRQKAGDDEASGHLEQGPTFPRCTLELAFGESRDPRRASNLRSSSSQSCQSAIVERVAGMRRRSRTARNIVRPPGRRAHQTAFKSLVRPLLVHGGGNLDRRVRERIQLLPVGLRRASTRGRPDDTVTPLQSAIRASLGFAETRMSRPSRGSGLEKRSRGLDIDFKSWVYCSSSRRRALSGGDTVGGAKKTT